jgi:hypothetical protein
MRQNAFCRHAAAVRDVPGSLLRAACVESLLLVALPAAGVL